MEEKQLHLLFFAAACFIAVIPLLVFAIVSQLRNYARQRPRWMAVLVAFLSGLAFLLGFFTEAGNTMPIVDVLINFFATAPVLFTIGYVCTLQANRYRDARGRRWLRRLFSRSYLILFVVLTVFTALQIRDPYRVFDFLGPIPTDAVFLQIPIMAVWAVFSALAAIVFFGSLNTRLPGLAQQIQNTAAGILMSALSIDAILWSCIFATRAYAQDSTREAIISNILSITNVTFVAELVFVGVSLGAYYSRAEVSKVAEKLLDLFHYTNRIEKLSENVPVHKHPYSGPYDYLKSTLETGELPLDRADKQKAIDAYRLAVLCHTGGIWDQDGNLRESTRQFVDLLEIYQQDLKDPDIAHRQPVQQRIQDYSLYEVYKKVEPMVMRNRVPSVDLIYDDMWVQLAFLAIADAGLVPQHTAEQITVQPKVRRLYVVTKELVWNKATR